MNHQNQFISLLLLLVFIISCSGQKSNSQRGEDSSNQDDLKPFYIKMPAKLSSIDTCPAFFDEGTRLLLTGTVYRADGVSPASGVILYYYQTAQSGIYEYDEQKLRNMPRNELGHSHGFRRGWMQTDSAGRYYLYTTKPGTYPSRDEPAHIHISLEDELMEEPYYIDEFVFDSDPTLSTARRISMENRGGSGVMRFVRKDDILIGERDIYLGLNIPNYPKSSNPRGISGKNTGEDIISFTPYHAYGADQGTKTCPICKYGWYNGIIYFVGNNPDWNSIKEWLVFLDKESQDRGEFLNVFFVYGNENEQDLDKKSQRLVSLGEELDIMNVALTHVPSFSDKTSHVDLNRINPEARNTFYIYKRSNIIGKFVNIDPTEHNFTKIKKVLDDSENDYFRLPKN